MKRIDPIWQRFFLSYDFSAIIFAMTWTLTKKNFATRP